MSLATIMLGQLAVARRVLQDGHEAVPAWRVWTSEGAFIILTPFDLDKFEQRDKALFSISRFMAWKKATGFVLTAGTRLAASAGRNGEEALFAVGVSYHERLGVMQRLRRGEALVFLEPEWLQPFHVDDHYSKLLPLPGTAISASEAAELARLFAKDGALRATRVS